MKKRQQQKAETRRRLLEVAKQLFLDQGYEPTTTRQLAQACEVSVGTVFSHFPDKPALLTAILYEDVEKALRKAGEYLKEDTGGVESLLVYARYLYGFYAQHPALSRALLTTTMFDPSSFGTQLSGFMTELSHRLIRVDGYSVEQAEVAARRLMADYFFVLVEGLGEERCDSAVWVKRLAQMCGGGGV